MFENELINETIEGVKEVYSTMVMMEVNHEDPVYNEKTDITSNLTSMIGLGGDISGMLAIHFTEEFAKKITGLFLGIDVEEIDEDVKDAVGEIANMVAGNLKVSYGTRKKDMKLAIPSTIVGESFKVSGLGGVPGVVIPFFSLEGKFWVELKCREN